MSQAIKLQLGLLAIVISYLIIRLLGISNLNLNLWQQIYWGNFIKNSLLLVITFIVAYLIFNQARLRQKTGPTIIKGSLLKKFLIVVFILGWLAIVTHTIFDSLKILLPFNLLPVYQFADLMDETIAHIFIYVPSTLAIFILNFLEIQRPARRINKKDITIISILSVIIGLVWGLNLSEGNLSLFTSFPLMIIFLITFSFLIKKHKLNLLIRPWLLFSLITASTSTISFAIWNLFFTHQDQLFMVLQ